MNLKENLLPVMEMFYTIQGEGEHTGKAAFFIRIGGCDVGCVWCDVKDSWDAEKHPLLSINQILEEVSKYPAGICVVTGGEPMMYDLMELTTALKQNGWRTHLETSGAYPISGNWDWICVSPKKFKPPLETSLAVANELKAIIFHPSDFSWAESFINKLNPTCKLMLQPEWSKSDQITSSVVDFVKLHPWWKISLQTHKYINVP